LRKIFCHFFLAPAVVVSTIYHGYGLRHPISPHHKVRTAGLNSLSSSDSRQGTTFGALETTRDIEQLWIDYVSGLAREGEARPDREATIVAIGIHHFVVELPMAQRRCAVFSKISRIKSLSG
jgi:hypothetical protein